MITLKACLCSLWVVLIVSRAIIGVSWLCAFKVIFSFCQWVHTEIIILCPARWCRCSWLIILVHDVLDQFHHVIHLKLSSIVSLCLFCRWSFWSLMFPECCSSHYMSKNNVGLLLIVAYYVLPLLAIFMKVVNKLFVPFVFQVRKENEWCEEK